MPRAVFSFTNNNPFYHKQSSTVKTIAAKFKQWLRASTHCLGDRSTALTLLLSANKLSANLVKTEYMILGTAPKLKALNHSPLIKLNGKSIDRVIKSDYLGLIIDESLSWKQYTSSLKLKISSALMAIKQVDLLPQESLITLYHSLVESRLRYCNTVWGNCGTSLKINYSDSKIEQPEL